MSKAQRVIGFTTTILVILGVSFGFMLDSAGLLVGALIVAALVLSTLWFTEMDY